MSQTVHPKPSQLTERVVALLTNPRPKRLLQLERRARRLMLKEKRR